MSLVASSAPHSAQALLWYLAENNMHLRFPPTATAFSRSLRTWHTCQGSLYELMRRLNIRSQSETGSVTAFAALPPAQMSTLQPDFGRLPPLPVIQGEDIRQRVFTHRSYYARSAHAFEDRADDPSPDNEKFEHLGDSVLGLVVTSLVAEMYPGLRVGPATKVRAKVVGNATLAEISVRYKLSDKLRLHPAQAVTLRASTNIQADVFESFIGGLYTDLKHDLAGCAAWLNPLLRPYVKAAYDAVRAEHGLAPLRTDAPASPNINGNGTPASPSASSHSSAGDANNIGHLALFNQCLQKGEARVEWVYSDQHPFGPSDGLGVNGGGVARTNNTPNDSFAAGAGNKSTPVWSAQVLVDGEVYGRGRGNTKKAARNECAKQGLVRMGVAV
ncbi:ribonuclease III domain-containing protein [Mycena albidolilacea]|uniref:Ribonuclease III domain-containing protein n=1 Tax=Mycena albidolilacea TaxID=1033008 RepID=A0AAD7AWA0_9AGAR|nr:ribonuclease III domain-containing protein [Mycena albidolilacea]